MSRQITRIRSIWERRAGPSPAPRHVLRRSTPTTSWQHMLHKDTTNLPHRQSHNWPWPSWATCRVTDHWHFSVHAVALTMSITHLFFQNSFRVSIWAQVKTMSDLLTHKEEPRHLGSTNMCNLSKHWRQPATSLLTQKSTVRVDWFEQIQGSRFIRNFLSHPYLDLRFVFT